MAKSALKFIVNPHFIELCTLLSFCSYTKFKDFINTSFDWTVMNLKEAINAESLTCLSMSLHCSDSTTLDLLIRFVKIIHACCPELKSCKCKILIFCTILTCLNSFTFKKIWKVCKLHAQCILALKFEI